MSSIPAQPLRVPFALWTMNILFVCFGDNESRGESETILTLFFQFGKQFFYGRIFNILGGMFFLWKWKYSWFLYCKYFVFLVPLWMFLREIWISINVKKGILDYGMYS